jgi:hypothetical protein
MTFCSFLLSLPSSAATLVSAVCLYRDYDDVKRETLVFAREPPPSAAVTYSGIQN